MHLLIYLKSPTRAFTITPAHVEEIKARYPDWIVTHVTTKEAFLEALPEAEMCILWYFKEEWYERAPRLKGIYTPAAGKDWVAQDPHSRITTHHGKFHGRLMSESLLAMMLYFNRRIAQCVDNQNKKLWSGDHLSDTVALHSQHVAIVGYGTIARPCARVLKGFGVKITGVKRSPRDLELDQDADQIVTIDGLEALLGTIDQLVFILPGGEGTGGIFTREHFSRLKKSCYLYNIGRGNCYKEKDLLWALNEGILAGAGLDVFEKEPLPVSSPLWQHPKVLITPHASAISSEYVSLFLEEFFHSTQNHKL